jgi:two-component system, cell cycle response regulator DivK
MEFDWQNKTILVAEDVYTNYLLLETAIKKTGATLLWAKNGQEAVDICLQRGNIDLILMDLRMPVKNGFLATTEIRALYPDIPIIAQTSYAMAEDRRGCLEAGCNDFIIKPFRLQSLYEIIEKYLLRDNS